MDSNNGEIDQQFQTSCNIQQTDHDDLQNEPEDCSALQEVPTVQQPTKALDADGSIMDSDNREIDQQFQTSCNIQQTEHDDLQNEPEDSSALQEVSTVQQEATKPLDGNEEDSEDEIETDGIGLSLTKGIRKVVDRMLPQQPNEHIPSYPKRDRGVFLLIANFTNDLIGYMQDRKELKQFFEAELNYTYLEFLNCTQMELLEALEHTKDKIKDLKSKEENPNRLVVAILTHGGVNGIHTCEDKGGVMRETEADNTTLKVTALETIFDSFKHDGSNLPEFKGLPKFFIIQACHGEEIVQAAGGRSAKGPDSVPEKDIHYQPNLPVDTDFLVLCAATKYNKAFVGDSKGSWLIHHMLEVFRKSHKNTDVEAMLKAVTLQVSDRRKSVTDEDGRQELALQVPFRQSTLRKTCLL